MRDGHVVKRALSYLVGLDEAWLLLVLHRRVALHQLLKPLVTVELLPAVTAIHFAAVFLLFSPWFAARLANASERIGREV